MRELSTTASVAEGSIHSSKPSTEGVDGLQTLVSRMFSRNLQEQDSFVQQAHSEPSSLWVVCQCRHCVAQMLAVCLFELCHRKLPLLTPWIIG